MKKISFLFLFLTSFVRANDFQNLLEYEKNSISVHEKVSPSVVSITNTQKIKRSLWSPVQEIPAGAGSGFVWDKLGHIVTNFHVTQGASEFVITFSKDKSEYKAVLVGAEPRKDIAVLKIINPPKNLIPITIGNSQNLLVGQKAIAFGSPFRFNNTMTVGTISAKERIIPGIAGLPINNMIQTDASINPGNSGGPLVDSQGRIIAMCTMIVSPSGASSGLGFGVPIDTIKSIVPQLIMHGKVIRPGLGVALLENQADYFDHEGLIIKYVEKKGAGGKAGLMGIQVDPQSGKVFLGDIILGINGKKLTKFENLYEEMEKMKVGDIVTLELKKNNKIYSKKIKLEAIP